MRGIGPEDPSVRPNLKLDSRSRGEIIQALSQVEHELRSRLEVARAVQLSTARGDALQGMISPL